MCGEAVLLSRGTEFKQGLHARKLVCMSMCVRMRTLMRSHLELVYPVKDSLVRYHELQEVLLRSRHVSYCFSVCVYVLCPGFIAVEKNVGLN